MQKNRSFIAGGVQSNFFTSSADFSTSVHVFLVLFFVFFSFVVVVLMRTLPHVYVRAEKLRGTVSALLFLAKALVAPPKHLSSPRLELIGVLTGTGLAWYVTKRNFPCRYFCLSQCKLNYNSGEDTWGPNSKWKPFTYSGVKEYWPRRLVCNGGVALHCAIQRIY